MTDSIEWINLNSMKRLKMNPFKAPKVKRFEITHLPMLHRIHVLFAPINKTEIVIFGGLTDTGYVIN